MTAAKRHSATPRPTAILQAEIADICRQIDRRTGASPGTAARAVYWHYWPPGPGDCVEVLARLHHDAAQFLADMTPDTGLDATNHHHTIPAAVPEYPQER